MARPKFPRLSRERRARIAAEQHPLAAPIDANPAVVNPAGYQEMAPPPDAIEKDAEASENCALLERARAEDRAHCSDNVPMLLKGAPRRRAGTR